MAGGGEVEPAFKKGIGYLNKRIQSSTPIVILLAAGIVVPMTVEHSNKKEAMHPPTMFCSYVTFLSGVALRSLVAECLDPEPCPCRYVAIKALVHACAFFLVSLSFSLSLMTRMNAVGTSITLAAAAAYVAHRLWRCAATKLHEDVRAYAGCEENLQQLLELSTNVTSMLFGGWFGMAFFYFQNNPEEARDARFLPSEYITFSTSVAASLLFVKAVPRRLAPCPRPVRELMALTGALVCGVVATALVIAASKVRGYAALALVPEAAALGAWCVQRARDQWQLPVALPASLGGGAQGEPPSHSFVSVSLTLLLAVLTYRAKDVDRALSTLYDEAFVLVTTAAVVAALAWRLLTQPPIPTDKPDVQAASRILAFSTFCLLVLSVLSFLGVMFGW
ncbi:hypothetical protein SEVIR_4G241400v4 [Setaria viridis]|uniref:Uncharacterized protein n=1 Tax=Setaria viridis TaxID=4556 RepID=A0A4U6V2N1_SETVI|nr:uncharacterized protein LOC117851768 [Setaria viridis]TKW22632.1 hypothetical protein SEVIR_4G241400v2 [Setaria viridis]TKW22633.1 hypothetical protein SEVIR_4G241400v2 [Setaria viridis]